MAYRIPNEVTALETWDPKSALVVLLDEELTEERTDKVLDYLMGQVKPHLPWWARWLAGPVRSALDSLLPEQLVQAVANALGVQR